MHINNENDPILVKKTTSTNYKQEKIRGVNNLVPNYVGLLSRDSFPKLKLYKPKLK